MSDDHDKQLEELAGRLRLVVESASLRGSGPARFVYAVGRHGAAEISWDGDHLWVEFWDSVDLEGSPARGAFYRTARDAGAAVVEALLD